MISDDIVKTIQNGKYVSKVNSKLTKEAGRSGEITGSVAFLKTIRSVIRHFHNDAQIATYSNVRLM